MKGDGRLLAEQESIPKFLKADQTLLLLLAPTVLLLSGLHLLTPDIVL